jgi:hypothetical protein
LDDLVLDLGGMHLVMLLVGGGLFGSQLVVVIIPFSRILQWLLHLRMVVGHRLMLDGLLGYLVKLWLW